MTSAPKNTLYVTTQGAYVGRDHETVQVRVDREVRLSVPMHHLTGIVCFGRVSVSPDLLGECAARGIEISLLTEQGRFLGRIEGPPNGASMLRRSQYRLADCPEASLCLARAFVIGKLANARTTLLRAARESVDEEGIRELSGAAAMIHHRLEAVARARSADEVRGHEGEAAAQYFGVFGKMIRRRDDCFRFQGRNRRPPMDPVNALLSFLYALLLHDACAALNAVGLDPSVGYLHADRPGRPSLALDLMEEFRSFLADRIALSMINLGQVKAEGFHKSASGAVEMDDATRHEVIIAYQKRKQEEIQHAFLKEKTTVGLLIHLQARLLARAIRGDLDGYPPFHAR